MGEGAPGGGSQAAEPNRRASAHRPRLAPWKGRKGPLLPDHDDHADHDDDADDDGHDYDVSPERARELARDHERPAADRFRELQRLEEEPDEDDLGEIHAQRLRELRGDRPSVGRTLLRQGKWLAVAVLAIVAVMFLAGLWFGRSDEPRAARTLLGDRVEPQPEVTAGIPDAAAPTSGVSDAEPTCGIRTEPVPPAHQVATILEGGVIVQYRPSALGDEQVERLADWAKGYLSHLLVAPNARIDAPIVATAFRHRMSLEELDTDVLTAFAAGYGDAQGPRQTCPITGG